MENNNFSTGLCAAEPGYDEALEYLYSRLPLFSRIGAAAYKPGLETSERLAEAFGNPERRFRSIHVAGTNGKGSTSHTLAAIFQSAGLKTGLYTSPHLVDFRERMRIDGKMIPRRKVVEFVERWKNSGYEGSPSFFELTMMMAFDWFAEQKVDIAVIEVGMGGRLDSTNIISPELCVITNISADHTQFLGTTLPAIAVEKAGIIKPGLPVVIGEAAGEVKDVFERKAEEVGAPIRFAEQNRDLVKILDSVPEGGWLAESPLCQPNVFVYPLGGDYQKKNLLTVLTAVDEIERRGILPLDGVSVRTGLEGVVTLTGLAGRWMIMAWRPLTICDTGHNEAGLTENFRQLERLMADRPGGRLRMVVGFVADKAIDKILRLFPKNADYYLTQARIPRALDAYELGERAAQAGIAGRVFPNVEEAVDAVLGEANEDDIIYIGGSTFIVADYLELFQ